MVVHTFLNMARKTAQAQLVCEIAQNSCRDGRRPLNQKGRWREWGTPWNPYWRKCFGVTVQRRLKKSVKIHKIKIKLLIGNK